VTPTGERPTYRLDLIQDAVRHGRQWITLTALLSASELGFGVDDVVACVLAIAEAVVISFKSDESRR
jgi:hypothetical protein